MKWIKYYHNADTSLKLQALIDELGVEGYGRYWLFLGLLSSKFDGTNETIELHFNEIHPKVRLKFRKSVDTFIRKLADFSLIQFETDGKVYKVTAPILLNLQDRDFKFTRNKRGDYAVVATDKNKNKNKEVEVDAVKEQTTTNENNSQLEKEAEKVKTKTSDCKNFETRFLPDFQELRSWCLENKLFLPDKTLKQLLDHYKTFENFSEHAQQIVSSPSFSSLRTDQEKRRYLSGAMLRVASEQQ